MNRFTYIVYALVVLATSTMINLSMSSGSSGSSRSWGGSGYSSGGSGWSYGGGHK